VYKEEDKSKPIINYEVCNHLQTYKFIISNKFTILYLISQYISKIYYSSTAIGACTQKYSFGKKNDCYFDTNKDIKVAYKGFINFYL